jgi:hypothetical protein
MARKYRNHRWVDSPIIDKSEECNFDCRMLMFCQTIAGDYDEFQFCRSKSIFNFEEAGTFVMALEQTIDHAWYSHS